MISGGIICTCVRLKLITGAAEMQADFKNGGVPAELLPAAGSPALRPEETGAFLSIASWPSLHCGISPLAPGTEERGTPALDNRLHRCAAARAFFAASAVNLQFLRKAPLGSIDMAVIGDGAATGGN